MTRYDFFRRRIAPVLFLGMVGLIAYDACGKEERTRTTIVLDFGEATADVRQVDAELMVHGESFGVFQRIAPPGGSIGPCRFETSLPEDSAQLRVDVSLRGKLRTITKTIHPASGSTTTVTLGDQLR